MLQSFNPNSLNYSNLRANPQFGNAYVVQLPFEQKPVEATEQKIFLVGKMNSSFQMLGEQAAFDVTENHDQLLLTTQKEFKHLDELEQESWLNNLKRQLLAQSPLISSEKVIQLINDGAKTAEQLDERLMA